MGFLGPSENCLSSAQTLETTVIKHHQNHFANHPFNHVQLGLERTRVSRAHFPPSNFMCDCQPIPQGTTKRVITRLKRNYTGIDLHPPSSRDVAYNIQKRCTVCFQRLKFVCFSVSFFAVSADLFIAFVWGAFCCATLGRIRGNAPGNTPQCFPRL